MAAAETGNSQGSGDSPQRFDFKMFKLDGNIFTSPVDELAVGFEEIGIAPDARAIVELDKFVKEGEIVELYNADGDPLEPPTAERLHEYLATRRGMRSGPMISDPNGIAPEVLYGFLKGVEEARERSRTFDPNNV